ncbi:MAG: ABC-2 family transporter protein [Verrucomicrobium sp.]|nr:ABC-2 family transporter protein [Verrucomicrobium sp.]
MRLLKIWLAAGRYSLTRELMFRGNFILWVLVEISWFALQLAFIEVLYLQVDAVAGWTKWQMVTLIGMGQVIQQVCQLFFLVNFIDFPELVRTGKLDFFLAQPAPVLFQVTTRRWDIGSTLNAFLAAGVTAFGAAHAGVPFTPLSLLAALLLVGAGVAIHYGLLLLFTTLSFWMTRSQGLVTAYYQCCSLMRQPREVFRGGLRFVFTWIVPLLLVANLPSRALFGTLAWREAAALVALSAAFVAVSIAFFHYGLRSYKSASS